MLSTKDPFQTEGHEKTDSEELEKYIPCKLKSKGSWSINIHIRQNRL